MPYLFDFSNILVDNYVAFCLGILFAVTINAEAQAFVAQFLGDVREKDENRFHFNAFRHLDLPGTASFFISGFGWPRSVDIDASKFARPMFDTVIIRFAGPVSNFLLASIISSISLILEQFSIDTQMLQIVVGINLIMAAANLLPIPPLAAASIIGVFIDEKNKAIKKTIWRVGPYVLLLLLIADKANNNIIINRFVMPIVVPIFTYLTKKISFGA
ncbi:MAG: site-2 protease family protein [Deltaproteobacteria bacterium]|nr:site-2 protease family protein [Deltaproteobacteria bacterium]